MLRAVPSFLVAVSVFWLGIMLIQVSTVQLGWVEVISPGRVEGLILPVRCRSRHRWRSSWCAVSTG